MTSSDISYVAGPFTQYESASSWGSSTRSLLIDLLVIVLINNKSEGRTIICLSQSRVRCPWLGQDSVKPSFRGHVRAGECYTMAASALTVHCVTRPYSVLSKITDTGLGQLPKEAPNDTLYAS
jgi:hypothetical protein